MSRQDSLSPSVSSSDLISLQKYQPLEATDTTVDFLKIVFKFLPLDGQRNLQQDICDCESDDEIRQLEKSLDTGLLRPLLSQGGKTPADSIESLGGYEIDSANRKDKKRLSWDRDFKHPPNEPKASLQAVHILPFSLGVFGNKDERSRMSAVWSNLFRCFPSLRSHNILSMASALHEEFGAFRFILEATPEKNRYKLKTFNRLVIFENHDPIIHADIGRILNASGRAELIERLQYDYGDSESQLAPDGATDIGSLLTVSKLSLLTPNQPRGRADRESKRGAQTPMSSTKNRKHENISPSAVE
ncbi:hypothetical protein BO71DRAFT_449017 [Aspergillus ellipticus CBS 707.79]|uniref:HNH nuclease domain-containing protein n=1 Tax=Aspergillus ellipticus CBS 707.79 TaxID=1448320 RepID=A0A319DPC9_9EURO|nr:hypothetical protein BO71DRAFT_449017 [Aspergillus ellipticus CBS 707.79]